MSSNENFYFYLFDKIAKLGKYGIVASIIFISTRFLILLYDYVFANNNKDCINVMNSMIPFINIITCIFVIYLCAYIGLKTYNKGTDVSDKEKEKEPLQVIGYLFNKECYAIRKDDGRIVIPYILVHLRQGNIEKWCATDYMFDNLKGDIKFYSDYQLKKIRTIKDVDILVNAYARQEGISNMKAAIYISTIMKQTHPYDSFRFQSHLNEIITNNKNN